MTTQKLYQEINPSITAKGNKSEEGTGYRTPPRLVLFFESGVDDGAFCPACDISIYGVEQVKALRDFCTLLLNEK